MIQVFKSLGLYYVWGLANFTAGGLFVGTLIEIPSLIQLVRALV